MYLQITSKCNMRCAHCCVSASPNKGSNMTKETLVKALDLAAERGEGIFIGGGEPTVHPQFWEFLGIILSYSNQIDLEESLGMIFNGKKTEDALALSRLARQGVLSVELSQDEYHDPIDPKVVKAFTVDFERRRDGDRRGIRTVNNIVRVGRGKRVSGATKGCPCEELIVDPEGKIYACGCRQTCFGTVDKPEIPQEYWEDTHCCWEKQKEKSCRVLDLEESTVKELEMAEG